MYILVKEGVLLIMLDIMNYILYSIKVLELVKIYLIVCVVYYDDFYC